MPLQKHIKPAMLNASVIACAAPVLTAAVTASNRPQAAPHTSAAAKKPTHTKLSMDTFPLSPRDPPFWEVVIHTLIELTEKK